MTQQTSNPGIGRIAYLLCPILVCILFVAVFPPQHSSSLIPNSRPPTASPLASLWTILLLGFFIFWSVQRLRNIGKNAWYVLLFFVPLANIYIGLLCSIAPPGYARTKKMDTPAIVLLILILFAVLVGLYQISINSPEAVSSAPDIPKLATRNSGSPA